MPDPITTAAAGVAGEAAKGLIVPVYQDALQPAAREVGKALQTVAKTVHIALAPVGALVWGYERIAEYLDRRLTEKLAGTPEERISTPLPNVAGPALEALRFTGSADDLREMYASLLAAAMDTVTAPAAHPAFVEIIKQLTPDEARILRQLSDEVGRPLINIRADFGDASAGGVVVARYVTMLDEHVGLTYSQLMASYLDNLVRLGLIEIPDSFLTKPGRYDDLENHPHVVAIRGQIDAIDGRNSAIERRLIALTSLGKQFVSACVLERAGEVPRSGT